jgi:hypothetical protein
MVAAGDGGSMEWSLRRIRANSVIGMWHETQRLASFPAGCRVWAATSPTRSSWHGRHALFASSDFRKRYRPLEVWQCMQESFPDCTHGLIRQRVYV